MSESRMAFRKLDEAAIKKTNLLRATGGVLEEAIESNVPPSREKALALTKLEEAVMWANKGIASEHPPVDL